MGGKHKRPKKKLHFSALLAILQSSFEEIEDHRVQELIDYPLPNFYKCAFALFYFQDKSLLEFQKQLYNKYRQHNLNTVFKVNEIPKSTQLRDVIDKHSYESIIPVFKQYFSLLQRAKLLDQFKFFNNSYLITLDGSDYFSSNKIGCKKCLTQKHKNGTTTFHHQILQATLVHPDKSQVIPLAPEFIKKTDGSEKQDCEINAGKRIIEKIRKDHPRLAMTIVADSLFSKQPFIEMLAEYAYSYILTAKPKDHKSLYADVESLRKKNLLDKLEIKKKGKTYSYEWINSVPLNNNEKCPLVNFVQLTIKNKNGKTTFKNVWVTDIEITYENVEKIVRGGRARWKIENECFNTLKNQGYHIDHNFGHGDKNLNEALFLLNLLAFFFHQIFELSDALYIAARATFSARVEYWNTIRVAFRLIVFDSWHHLLEHIHSPPDLEYIKKVASHK